MVDRMVVFIDYQNTYRGARDAFFPDSPNNRDGQVHPLALANILCRMRQENGLPTRLDGVRVYRGLPDGRRDPRGYGAALRQGDRWEKAGVTLLARPLRYPADWPASSPEEKGVDVQLAIDFVAMALRSEYDVGVLVSRDTDLRPALEVVRSLGRRVEVAAWRARNGRSPRLDLPGQSGIWCHWLPVDAYGRCADPTDYGDLGPN